MEEESGEGVAEREDLDAAAMAAGNLVLVVDDDSGVRQLYSTFLLRQGFEVIAVRTGREGLAKAKDVVLSGVILDLALPDDNGYELCKKLRRIEGAQAAFVVMISGTHNLSEEKAFAAGADAVIKKPFSTADLARVLCKGIADRAAGRPSKREIERGTAPG